MTISEISKHSVKDEEIIDAKACLECDSWKPGSLKLLYPFRFGLSAIGPLLLRGNRIVIPQSLRNQVLELAHERHPGEVPAMKRRLRSKEEADKKRGAQEAVINVGDKLLLKNVFFPSKWTRNFKDTEFEVVVNDIVEIRCEVVEKDKNIVKVRAGGRTLTRNVSHLRKIPINANHLDISRDSSLSSSQPKMTSTQDHQGVEEGKGQQLRQSLDPPPLAPLAARPLKLKLVTKGGMWEPAMSGDVIQKSSETGKKGANGVTEQKES
ncbi:hypothetical protein KR074_011636 [Drosophila pseudoananassae]|nr:hypothetical protein KR074_011636 [Drosophila pseudoananassae]